MSEDIKYKTKKLKEDVGELIMKYQKETGLEVTLFQFTSRSPTLVIVRVPE